MKLALSVALTIGIAAAAAPAMAACYVPHDQLPATTISGFESAPQSLLQQYNGAQLISRVRDLAASDPTTLPVIMTLLKGANNHITHHLSFIADKRRAHGLPA